MLLSQLFKNILNSKSIKCLKSFIIELLQIPFGTEYFDYKKNDAYKYLVFNTGSALTLAFVIFWVSVRFQNTIF